MRKKNPGIRGTLERLLDRGDKTPQSSHHNVLNTNLHDAPHQSLEDELKQKNELPSTGDDGGGGADKVRLKAG